MKQKLLAASLVVMALAPTTVALAAFGPIPIPEPVDVPSTESFYELLEVVANVIFTVLIILAVIFILFAAFYYLTAAGDPTKLEKAKTILIYAGVGIAVALVARGIPLLVRSVLD